MGARIPARLARHHLTRPQADLLVSHIGGEDLRLRDIETSSRLLFLHHKRG
jgi:hypothetical protein